MRSLALAAVLLLSAALMAGCGDDDDSSDDATPLAFEGTTTDGVSWELEAIEGAEGPCVNFRVTARTGSGVSGECAGVGPSCGAIGVATNNGPDPTLATGPTAASVESVTVTGAQGVTGPSEEASLVRVSEEDAAAIGAKQGFGWFVASIPGKARRVSLVGHGPGDELLDWPILLNGGAEPSCQR